MALSRAFCLAACVLLLAALATAKDVPAAKESAKEVKKEAAKEAAKEVAKDAPAADAAKAKCVEKLAAPMFTPDGGALYCPHGENNATGCRPMTNGVENIFRFAGTNVQQLVKFDCKTEIKSLDFKIKLAQFLSDDAVAALMFTINNVYAGKIAVDKTFTDKRGERGTLWVGGPLEDPIPGQGEGGDEYVVKVMLMNDLPAASGALIALSDQESVAKAA